MQEVASQSLLQPTRQRYHERIVQVLTSRFPEMAETQPELVAHHATAAGWSAQAIASWQRAGEMALARSAQVEAMTCFRRGLELLMTLPETPVRADPPAGLAYLTVTHPRLCGSGLLGNFIFWRYELLSLRFHR